MTDGELFKEIVRAVRDIPESQVGAALAKIRKLIAESTPDAAPTRSERGGKDRMFRGGMDRSAGGDDAS